MRFVVITPCRGQSKLFFAEVRVDHHRNVDGDFFGLTDTVNTVSVVLLDLILPSTMKMGRFGSS